MAGHIVGAPTGHVEGTFGGHWASSRLISVGLAVGAIWVAVLVASIYAPVMITGASHERLAIAALGDWLWGGLATGLLLLAAAFTRPEQHDIWPVVAVVTAFVWFAVAVASVFAPDLVTGTDPTSIPLAAMLAPIVGAVVTAFLAVFAAGMGARARD